MRGRFLISNWGGTYRAEARGRPLGIGRVEAGSRARGEAKWVNGDGEQASGCIGSRDQCYQSRFGKERDSVPARKKGKGVHLCHGGAWSNRGAGRLPIPQDPERIFSDNAGRYADGLGELAKKILRCGSSLWPRPYVRDGQLDQKREIHPFSLRRPAWSCGAPPKKDWRKDFQEFVL